MLFKEIHTGIMRRWLTRLRTKLRSRQFLTVLVILTLICGFYLGFDLMVSTDKKTVKTHYSFGHEQKHPGFAHKRLGDIVSPLNIPGLQRDDHQHSKTEKLVNTEDQSDHGKELEPQNSYGSMYPKPNYNVHVFYYAWYGNPDTDKTWLHWNHPYLPHWDKKEDRKWPHGVHAPPEDIGASFYPELGPYSSRNITVIDNHMQQIRSAGIGVLALSWYPPEQADDQGWPHDDLVPTLLDIADKYSLKICFHIEPYKNRNHTNMQHNIKYIIKNYGNHNAFYKYTKNGRDLPLFYIYDSYLLNAKEWAKIFKPNDVTSIRGTEYDGIFIGLLVNQNEKQSIVQAWFDGIYTYFASNGFTYGSSIIHWKNIAKFAKDNNLIFIPSVGPGYDDTHVRAWNGRNTKLRKNGKYYETSLKAAISANPDILSITSFNEWHEGTQIEKAVPFSYGQIKYLNYDNLGSDYYLKLSEKWVKHFEQSRGIQKL